MDMLLREKKTNKKADARSKLWVCFLVPSAVRLIVPLICILPSNVEPH